MEYANTERGTTARGCLLGMVAIVIGIMTCSGGYYFVVDSTCVGDADTWLPAYPGAELIEETSDTLFRPFGIGETTQTYFTTDSQLDVRGWYLDFEDERREAGDVRGGNFFSFDRRIFDAPDDEGTYIRYTVDCASELAF